MATLIEQLITKMGLRDEPNAMNKTTELLRLLELRSINVPVQVNEYGKHVLCADIAADVLSITIDKQQALKLSGLSKANYATTKRMFEKILDLNRIVGVKEICIQLNLNDVAMKATEMLELYKKVFSNNDDNDADITHPQYAAMAIFHACKNFKHKIPKQKLMAYSHLRPTQWLHLEKRWEQFLIKNKDNLNKVSAAGKKSNDAVDDQKMGKKRQSPLKKDHGSKNKKTMDGVENYETWKQRMLQMATERLQLEHQHFSINEMEKENVILGL